MGLFKGPLAQFSAALASLEEEALQWEGCVVIWSMHEQIFVCFWLCACSMHPLCGHVFHLVRSNPTGQRRRQGKFRSLYASNKYGKVRFWIPLVISGVIILFLRVLMASVQEKGQ